MGIPRIVQMAINAKERLEAERERRRYETLLAKEERKQQLEEQRQVHIQELTETSERDLLVLIMLALEDLQSQVSELDERIELLEGTTDSMSWKIDGIHFGS